jgi:hypothetical protein
MIHWTGEADTPAPSPTSPDGNNEAEETTKPVSQPRYLEKDELYGFHNFAVLDSLIKRHLR